MDVMRVGLCVPWMCFVAAALQLVSIPIYSVLKRLAGISPSALSPSALSPQPSALSLQP